MAKKAAKKKKTKLANAERKIEIRVTPEVHEQIHQEARAAGLTASEYGRRRMLSRPVVPDNAARVDAQLLSELNRISVALRRGVGNNLNQLVKDWNSGLDPRMDWIEVHDQLKTTLLDLELVIGQVADASIVEAAE